MTAGEQSEIQRHASSEPIPEKPSDARKSEDDDGARGHAREDAAKPFTLRRDDGDDGDDSEASSPRSAHNDASDSAAHAAMPRENMVWNCIFIR